MFLLFPSLTFENGNSFTNNSLIATNFDKISNIDAGNYSGNFIIASICTVPDMPISIIGNSLVAQGSTQTYSVAHDPGATDYTWTLPPTWTGTSTTNSIIVTVGTGGGDVEVTANNLYGSSSASIKNVNVLPFILPQTKLRDNDCGRIDYILFPFRQLNTYAVIEDVFTATTYEFEISTNNAFTGIVASRNSKSRSILFTDFGGLNWNTQYFVHARAWVGLDAGPWGQVCQIGFVQNPSISGVPSPFLDPHSCDRQNVTTSTGLLAVYIPGVTSYTFKFYTDAGLTTLFTSQANRARVLTVGNLITPLNPCTDYWVTLVATKGFVSSTEGPACPIKTTCIIRGGQELVDFTVNTYPNPSNGAFNVTVNSPDNGKPN